jgi:hypothetical protein
MGTKKQETFTTVSDKVTKDTLSVEKRQELIEKVRNNTITEKERERLKWDDSWNTNRSTIGNNKVDRIKYNPNVEYFMIDYHLRDEVKWVRMSYMTQWDLLPYIRDFTENFTDFSGFRIHSERELDEKIEVKCDDGEVREFTQRQLLFGDKYEKFSDMVKDKNLPFLHDMKKNRFPEELKGTK